MTCIGGLLNTVTGSVILTADEVKEVEGHIDQLNAENAKLRELFTDFWTWVRSGAYEQFMEIAERAREMGLIQ